RRIRSLPGGCEPSRRPPAEARAPAVVAVKGAASAERLGLELGVDQSERVRVERLGEVAGRVHLEANSAPLAAIGGAALENRLDHEQVTDLCGSRLVDVRRRCDDAREQVTG